MGNKFDNKYGEIHTEQWLTPPAIVHSLGVFDLDPCAPIKRPWPTATNHFTIQDDGLVQPWAGRVFLNPPYGTKTHLWMKRLAEHGNGIALIYARTETKAFFPWVWDYAHSIMFFNKRLTFHHVTGEMARSNGGAPSCLVAYGANNTQAIAHAMEGRFAPISGVLIHL